MNEVAGRLTHTGLLGLQDSLVTASLIRLKPEHLRPALSTHLNHESGILGLKGRWALAARRMRVRRASVDACAQGAGPATKEGGAGEQGKEGGNRAPGLSRQRSQFQLNSLRAAEGTFSSRTRTEVCPWGGQP